jgi:crotonobetainyl-CoA:carnitine CoA-transferase CaiB-like acyl-CoA transferase
VGDEQKIGMGPIFCASNRGKRSIVLDLKHDEDRTVLDRLVERTDILVHNTRISAARRLGVDARRLQAINPRLVHCTLRGYGAGGPYADRPAYDDVIQAISGLAAVQGGTGSPEYVRSPVADKVAGLMASAAVLAALHARDATGVGGAVEVPMFETVASFLLLEQQGGWLFDPPRGPTGYARTRSPYRRPYQTADGHLAVMVYTDAQWRSFFSLIGHAEMADDPRYRTIRDRTEHIDELYELLDDELRTRTSAEWVEYFDECGIPAGPVNKLEDLFDDPHLAATGFFETEDHRVAGRARYARQPVSFGGLPGHGGTAPLLGEHTGEVIAELKDGVRDDSGD